MILPSLCIIVLVYNVYLLGQPNLILLALLLGSFACLRLGRPISAGALVATAAAIKAFPILALGYLIYRRMWTASTATVAVLAAWLLPRYLSAHQPRRSTIWSRVVWGMLFTYNAHGIAQRPFRSYSYKNQSIMAARAPPCSAICRRMGESVLSRRAKPVGPRPLKGHHHPDRPIDASLLTFLQAPLDGETSTNAASTGAVVRGKPECGPSREHGANFTVEDSLRVPNPRLPRRVEGQRRGDGVFGR